jgi:hypothetical protein
MDIIQIAATVNKKQFFIGASLVAAFIIGMVAWFHFVVAPHDKQQNEIWEKSHPNQHNVTIVYPQ